MKETIRTTAFGASPLRWTNTHERGASSQQDTLPPSKQIFNITLLKMVATRCNQNSVESEILPLKGLNSVIQLILVDIMEV